MLLQCEDDDIDEGDIPEEEEEEEEGEEEEEEDEDLDYVPDKEDDPAFEQLLVNFHC